MSPIIRFSQNQALVNANVAFGGGVHHSKQGLTHIEERSTVQGCPGDLARSSLLFQVLSHPQLLAYELLRKYAIVRADDVPTILAGEEELHTGLDRSVNQQLLLVKFGLRSPYTANQRILTTESGGERPIVLEVCNNDLDVLGGRRRVLGRWSNNCANVELAII
jgi:hypothetical protein